MACPQQLIHKWHLFCALQAHTAEAGWEGLTTRCSTNEMRDREALGGECVMFLSGYRKHVPRATELEKCFCGNSRAPRTLAQYLFYQNHVSKSWGYVTSNLGCIHRALNIFTCRSPVFPKIVWIKWHRQQIKQISTLLYSPKCSVYRSKAISDNKKQIKVLRFQEHFSSL